MVFAKRDQIIEFLIFLFFILFPFGQLIRLNFGVIRIQPIDLVVIAANIIFLTRKFKIPPVFKYFKNFIYSLLFSFIFSFALFNGFNVVGLLYLIRLLAYIGFFLVLLGNAKNEQKKELLFKSLITVAVVTGVFGWLQYFFYPDFRSFKIWGWDDHLFRLIGTFFDPTFTGIILVLGFLAAFSRKKIFLSLFFLLTIAFTYARAAYLALFAGLITLGWLTKNIKRSVILGVIFSLIVLFLPTPAGEGVNLKRLYSVESRLENYKETISIFKKSPLSGVGYNNLCVSKVKYLEETDTSSHACSGADSSILLVLATTGIVGFLIFTYLILQTARKIEMNVYGMTLAASAVSLFVHSQFANSLFYPWVMGWTLMLTAISLRGKAES